MLTLGVLGTTLPSLAANVNPAPGSLYTYLGPSLGADWVTPSNQFNVLSFGATGDGFDDDSLAFSKAGQACGLAGGGQVTVPASTKPYRIAHGLGDGTTLPLWPGNCPIVGLAGGMNWPQPFNNFSNLESDWTSRGVTIRCEDLVNNCIYFNTPGNGISNINIWHVQPTPAVTTACATPCTFTHGWTPTNFPFDVQFGPNANFFRLVNNNFIDSTNCVDAEGAGTGIAGIYSYILYNSFGCATTGIKLRKMDNTLVILGNHHELWWMQGSSDWWGWLEGGGQNAAIDACYVANPMISHNEYAFLGTAWKIADCSVTSGFGPSITGMSYFTGVGNSFNEVCNAVVLGSSTTHFLGSISDTIIASDTTTSQGPVGQCSKQSGATTIGNFLFQLNSDNANLTLNGVLGAFIQGLAFIGGGGGGSVHGQFHVSDVNISQYSQFQNGTPLILTDTTGSIAEVGDLQFAFGSNTFTPGVKCSGACVTKIPNKEIAANLQTNFSSPGWTCNNTTVRSQLFITDLSAAPSFRATINSGSGGGSNRNLVGCDGSNWLAQ